MMAARLPGLLPPLTPKELLETSMVWSVAGLIERGALTRDRPFRSPHHSASMAALTGGGLRAKPGEASLAHNGVLFLDELPEYIGGAILRLVCVVGVDGFVDGFFHAMAKACVLCHFNELTLCRGCFKGDRWAFRGGNGRHGGLTF
jgi:hypothetical protein